MPDTNANTNANTDTGTGSTPPAERKRLVTGPGVLLVWLYGVITVGAVSRSVYQISTEFDQAPLPYTLTGLAALVYCFITYSLVRGGRRPARRR